MRKAGRIPAYAGMSQVELMMVVLIVSIGFLGLISAFGGISGGLTVSRTRALAHNLAQEKIEAMKNISYYRLLVTTPGGTAIHSLGFSYDTGYYPPESITVGQIPYTRYIYVEKVRESGADLATANWNDPDTGMKRIHVHVVWSRRGGEKKVTLVNLHKNPERVGLNVTVTGRIVTTGTPVGISGARAWMVQNPSYGGTTDAGGNFTFRASTGNWTVRASAAGYFDGQVSTSIASEGSFSVGDIALSPMGTGRVSGYAWYHDRILISQVVTSTQPLGAPTNYEYIELYNPTTYSIRIGTNSSNQTGVAVRYKNGPGGGYDGALDSSTLNYNTINAPASGYFLIANTNTVTILGITRTADAVYKTLGGGVIDLARAGGVGLWDVAASTWIDRLGWQKSGEAAPSDFVETAAFPSIFFPGWNGLQADQLLQRHTSTSGYSTGDGPAWDTDDNSLNFSVSGIPGISSLGWPPRDSTVLARPVVGRPAAGSLVTATDGLSVSTAVWMEGSAPRFTLTSVATGTWVVLIASGSRMIEISSVTATDGGTTWIPNANTTPQWLDPAPSNSSRYSAFLSSANTEGLVSGQVILSGGSGLSGIIVRVSGNPDTATDSGGNYRLRVDVTAASTVTVTANPGNANPSYTEESQNVEVSPGVVKSGVDFALKQGGSISGRVTINGVDPLPNAIVVASQTIANPPVFTAVADGNGDYTIVNISSGKYVVAPALESGESVTSPAAGYYSETIVAGSALTGRNFTVSNAFGTISGKVEDGEAITTGVLLIATTFAIIGDPPDNTSSLRSGNAVYYAVASQADGTYKVRVRPGTYRLKGWYTKFSGGTPQVLKDEETGIVVTAGQTTSRDLNGPWNP